MAASAAFTASKNAIIDQHAKIEELRLTMAGRSAGGGALQGRYKRYDTARKIFIKSVVVHQLRNGKLLDAHDEKMLFGPHDDDATATEKRELNAWYEKVKRDPRCCTAHRCATTRRSWLRRP